MKRYQRRVCPTLPGCSYDRMEGADEVPMADYAAILLLLALVRVCPVELISPNGHHGDPLCGLAENVSDISAEASQIKVSSYRAMCQ